MRVSSRILSFKKMATILNEQNIKKINGKGRREVKWDESDESKKRQEEVVGLKFRFHDLKILTYEQGKFELIYIHTPLLACFTF